MEFTNPPISSYSLPSLQTHQPCCWINTEGIRATRTPDQLQQHLSTLPLTSVDLQQAHDRWTRLIPVLQALFPTEAPDGRITSPLRPASTAFQALLGLPPSNTLYIKEDNKLAVCGSVKARGGLYETFAFAEKINNDWILDDDSQISLLSAIQEGLMEDYQVVVGSTGNLGLSVGLAASAMGMKSTIHMSNDAKQWKKDLLQERGSIVHEHVGSYGVAVEEGRKAAELDANAHFVDDETSTTLFLGYAAAALELKTQITLTEEQNLVVYIPCGVGGAPSGICWGLKQVFGTQVTVLFAEPTHAPCVLLAMGGATKDWAVEKDAGAMGVAMGVATKDWAVEKEKEGVDAGGEKAKIGRMTTCFDLGLDVKTEADGLACGAASPLCCAMVQELCAGIFTVDDAQLFVRLAQLVEMEGEDAFMEPSCCAALEGPGHLLWVSKNGATEEERELCAELLEGSVHVVWATGGALVPMEERSKFVERGRVK